MPHPVRPKLPPRRQFPMLKASIVVPALVLVIGFFSIPSFLTNELQSKEYVTTSGAFPVTVNPERKEIIEDPVVDAILDAEAPTRLTAAALHAEGALALIANLITSIPGYSLIAGSETKFVTIHPGYRKEEVARAFGGALGWTRAERLAFQELVSEEPPVIEEGKFQPGTYRVSSAMTQGQIQVMLYERFSDEILSRYSEETAARVPLDDALTIASMIEREAAGWEDMRLISGIMWNRLFTNMNLQIDATLQYAKANNAKDGVWWPKVVPKDKYIKSAYNTYQNEGLPPGPISSPSVAAVMAALNPKKTDCIFYFHDDQGRFFCSETYEEHVAKLKKSYGRGK